MTKLSLAAQAVAKAALYVSSCDPEDYPNQAQEIAAAALRAAADQVVPESREHHPATFDEKHRKVSAFDVRNQLLSIAGSLENQ